MFTTSRMKLAVVTGTAAIALIAAGCSNDDSTPAMNHDSTTGMASTSAQAAARTDFNAADITFLQGMYPHHAQAVEMAKLVPSRSQNQELIVLAKNIEQAQSPEMQQMTTLLQAFGKDAPSTTMNHEGGHSAMTGMMTADQMASLERASGDDFDRQWLQMMIDHHNGAVSMANAEMTDGVNADAKAMAKAIVVGQQAEIDQMRGMLRK